MAHLRVLLVLPLLAGILNCGVKGDPVPYVQLHPPETPPAPSAPAPTPAPAPPKDGRR